MSSFSQMTPRLFGADPFIGSTPIHSLTDPWLDVGIQLMPLPQAVLRMLMVTLPTYGISVYALPALMAAFGSRYEHDEEEQSLLLHLKEFSKLWLNPSTLLKAVKTSQRIHVPDEIEKIQLNQIHMKHCITLKQGTRMKRRFARHASRIGLSLVGQWHKFLQGRTRIVADDINSELTSQSGIGTIRAGSQGRKHLPRRRELFEPTGNTRLDQRFFLMAEIEQRRNATMHMNQMMKMLEPDYQAGPRRSAPEAINPDQEPKRRERTSFQRSLDINEGGQFRTHQGRIERQTDAERADEIAERLQAQLLYDDAFPPVSPIAVDGRDTSSEFMLNFLHLSDPSSSSSSLQVCRP